MYTALVLALALSAPHEDPQGRFEIELPDGWKFSKTQSTPEVPVFTGTKRRKAKASATVMVSKSPDAIGLPGVHKRRLERGNQRPRSRLVDDAPTVLGGYRARRLVYEQTSESGTKLTVQEVFTQVYNRAFVLTLVTDKRQAGSFEEDFAFLVRKLEPKDPKKAAKSKSASSPWVGRWVKLKDPDAVLVLGPDGSLEMGSDQGSYAISADTIVTLLKNGGQEVYQWNVNGATLVLQADGKKVQYRRAP